MSEWERKRLGDVITLEYGKPLPPTFRISNGTVPVYGANGIKDRTNTAFRNDPTIIVGRKGSAGEIQLTEGPFWPLDVTYFVEFDRARHDLKFLYHLLDWIDLRTLAKGIKPGVNRNEAYNIPVSVPPLAEQRRIVSVLDEAFAAIATATANAEKNLANARELLLGYLDGVLSDRESGVEDSRRWELVPLGEICEVLDRLRKPITKSDRRTGEYPYYGATGIVDWVDDFIFDEPLILLGEDGAKWGAGERSAFSALRKYWVNNHAHVLRPNRKILSDEWLIYYLNMADLMPYITGVTVPKLNQERMRSIPIPLPSLEMQHQLVAKMDAISKQAAELIATNKNKIEALSRLKQSLLHRAFSGELNELEPLAA